MTPEQTRLLAESFSKLEGRLPELGAAVYAKLFEIAPDARPMFKGNMDEQNAKLAKVFAEFVRVQTRSKHFLPVTQQGGEAVIPGVGELGSRHEQTYKVEPRHYAAMREALLNALHSLLGESFNEDIAVAWGEAFTMLSTAMQTRAGQNVEGQAFARLLGERAQDGGGPEAIADRLFGKD